MQTPETIIQAIQTAKHAFVLVHMTHCGACVQMMPEWDRMMREMESFLSKHRTIIILKVESEMLPLVPIIKDVNAFPTIRHYTNAGTQFTEYANRPRTSSAFIEWIKKSAHGNKSEVGAGVGTLILDPFPVNGDGGNNNHNHQTAYERLYKPLSLAKAGAVPAVPTLKPPPFARNSWVRSNAHHKSKRKRARAHQKKRVRTSKKRKHTKKSKSLKSKTKTKSSKTSKSKK